MTNSVRHDINTIYLIPKILALKIMYILYAIADPLPKIADQNNAFLKNFINRVLNPFLYIAYRI